MWLLFYHSWIVQFAVSYYELMSFGLCYSLINDGIPIAFMKPLPGLSFQLMDQ